MPKCGKCPHLSRRPRHANVHWYFSNIFTHTLSHSRCELNCSLTSACSQTNKSRRPHSHTLTHTHSHTYRAHITHSLAPPLLTPTLSDRLPRLLSILREWDGYISVSVYAANILEDYKTLLAHLDACGCACSSRLSVHLIVGAYHHPYPINIMRNIALSNVQVFGEQVDLMSPYDIDFVPSPGLCRRVIQWGESLPPFNLPLTPRMYVTHPKSLEIASGRIYPMNPRNLRSPRIMLLAPAFEFTNKDADAVVTWPKSKSHLLELTESGEIERFHPNFEGQDFNFSAWAAASAPFLHSPIALQNEHYAWFSRALLSRISPDPLCDESFFDRGYNKIICYFRVRALGFAPIVVPDAWLIHVPESEESIANVLMPDAVVDAGKDAGKEKKKGAASHEGAERISVEDKKEISSKNVSLSASKGRLPRRRPTPIHYKRQYHVSICRQLTSLGWANVSRICSRYCGVVTLGDRLSFVKSRKYMTLCYNDVVLGQGLLGIHNESDLKTEVEGMEKWMGRQEKRVKLWEEREERGRDRGIVRQFGFVSDDEEE